jgi:uncharacterized protein YbjT (DUF2867 family)
MILVIGGRSKIGSALIGSLLAQERAVRALARSGESGFLAGVEVAAGDLADPDSLANAMEGVDRVFLLCGPREDEVALNQNAIDAAKGAGVELLVRSSILGSDPQSPATFLRHHGVCDAYLRDANVQYAIVRPNLFMQNIQENTIPSIGEDRVFYANAGQARISMVDTRDVGAVAAMLLTKPGHEGEEVDLTGPEALSYADVAAKLSRRLGRSITYLDAPDDAVHQALAGYGMGDWMAEALVELFQDYRRSGEDGYAAQVTESVQRLSGRAPRTLDQLLAKAAG